MVLEHPGAVVVLAVDDEERVFCLRQYRHPARMRMLELPAGLLDVEGEEPRAAAERELLEEGGLEASDWVPLGSAYSSPGITTEQIHYFLARGLREADRGDFTPAHEEADMDDAVGALRRAAGRLPGRAGARRPGADRGAHRPAARSGRQRGLREARVGVMKVGVPKEVKNHEYRVAITPIGVHELVAHGHEVVIQKDAGVGSSITDDEYVAAGAKIVGHAEEAWGTDGGVDMVLKVKEPIAEEYARMREGLVLFTYLHLAADKPLTEELINRKVTGIAYETVQLPSGGLPLLYPMSEVAGCLAPQVGAHFCSRPRAAAGC